MDCLRPSCETDYEASCVINGCCGRGMKVKFSLLVLMMKCGSEDVTYCDSTPPYITITLHNHGRYCEVCSVSRECGFDV